VHDNDKRQETTKLAQNANALKQKDKRQKGFLKGLTTPNHKKLRE
jgi:hypothetical protein